LFIRWMPIMPVTTAESMILSTVKSVSSNCPRMTSYLVTPPFCSRKPNTIPNRNPQARGSLVFIRFLLSGDQGKEERGHQDSADEKADGRDPARHGKLHGAADAVPAGA